MILARKEQKLKNKIFLVSLLIFAFAIGGNAQQKTDTLDWLGFRNLVKKYHPITVQARLLDDLAKAKKTKALGGFEPKLGVDFDRKIYDGTEYYQFLTPELKLPLWYLVSIVKIA